MKLIPTLLVFLLNCLPHAHAEIRRLLYCASPDGAQVQGISGTGLLVFDIDRGHKFVRRIEIPIFKEGLRGLTGCTTTKRLYYSTTNRRLGCFDLETDKVVWDKQFPAGCDRACVTPDGRTIYAPLGFWYRGEDSGLLAINPENGELLKQIPVGPQAHNSIASLDGKFVYLGTATRLSQLDASTEEKIPRRTHGVGLTPDESQLWISDQGGKRIYTFDATVSPPKQTGHLDLSMGGHGWICFSLDGKYGYNHTPDVFEVSTGKKIATLTDENGMPFASSKYIEVHFEDNKVVKISCEFGLGRN